MFGIEFPILAFTHCRDVVAAVTKAGGMGVLGAAGVSPEQLDIDLRWIRDEVGDRPFGVDVIVPAKYEGQDEGGLSWAALQDTHHFFALLQKHGVRRTQALRLAGEEWAEALAPSELPKMLEAAAATEVPIMVFVGNQHCIQIHSGPVRNLRWLDSWFNVMDAEFNLHLQSSAVRQLWRVRKPSTDGVITSLEAFDADGELILQLFGVRKPGVAEREDWRALAHSAVSLPR